jgi:hypothetical protein
MKPLRFKLLAYGASQSSVTQRYAAEIRRISPAAALFKQPAMV